MLLARDVVDPGEVECRGSTPDRRVLVAQRLHPEPLEFTQPRRGVVDEVLVVAGDEEGPFPGRQVPQRFRRRTEFLHRPVDQISDDRDEVRFGLVDHPDDPLGVRAAGKRTEVDVGHHSDPKTVECGVETTQPHRDSQRVGRAERAGHSDADEADGGGTRRGRARPCEEHPPVHGRRVIAGCCFGARFTQGRNASRTGSSTSRVRNR